jgi:predicted RNA-binding Zn ribbon-like protein
MDGPDFPILGTEPVAVEFANTRYGVGDERIDFLGTARWIELWFTLVSPHHALPPPHGAMGGDAPRVRALRDAVHAVLSAAIDGQLPEPGAVDTVNAAAAAAPTHLRLDWTTPAPTAHRLDTTGGSAAVLGRIATCCIQLVTRPHSSALRRCGSPDCSLMFVRNHPRRRYCHPSCAHRDRQARYYRRHLTGATP